MAVEGTAPQGFFEVSAADRTVLAARRRSLEEQLQMRKRKLTEELADVTRALEMLQQNPQAAEMLNLLARLGAVY